MYTDQVWYLPMRVSIGLSFSRKPSTEVELNLQFAVTSTTSSLKSKADHRSLIPQEGRTRTSTPIHRVSTRIGCGSGCTRTRLPCSADYSLPRISPAQNPEPSPRRPTPSITDPQNPEGDNWNPPEPNSYHGLQRRRPRTRVEKARQS